MIISGLVADICIADSGKFSTCIAAILFYNALQIFRCFIIGFSYNFV